MLEKIKLWRISLKIPGNVPADSGECSERFWEQADSGESKFRFLEILLVFHQILLLNCYETMKNNNY